MKAMFRFFFKQPIVCWSSTNLNTFLVQLSPNVTTFKVPYTTTVTHGNSPVYMLMDNFNILGDSLDLSDTSSMFKKKLELVFRSK